MGMKAGKGREVKERTGGKESKCWLVIMQLFQSLKCT